MTKLEKIKIYLEEYESAKTKDEQLTIAYKIWMVEDDDAPIMWGIVDLSELEKVENK